MNNLFIRIATKNDLPEIVSIYNQYINTTVTMDTEEATISSKTNWFNAHDQHYPIICYINNNEILGWVSLSRWSDRIGYAKTIEESVYVSKKYHGEGIGKLLLQEAIKRAKQLQYHCILARIDATNQISLSLHEKSGFITIGTMQEVGFKFNKFVDVKILQLLIH